MLVLAQTCPEVTINNLIVIYDLIYDKLLWLYPFAWVVVIIRKIFYA